MGCRLAWLCAAAAITVAVLVPPGAAAAQSGQDAAAAEALFREARLLMDEGEHAAACQKLEASLRLDPAVGTLLNLADCNERIGKTASAWAQFLEAATLSRRAGSERREQVARERAAALEPRLIRFTIVVPDDARVAGLTITRDGKPFPSGAWDSGSPIDPGTHEVVASAPGRVTWRTTVVASEAVEPVTVTVPPLEQVAPPPTPAASAEAPAPARPVTPAYTPASASDEGPGDGSSQRLLGLIIGGAGAAALLVGGGFALGASSRWSDADCPDGACRTPADQEASEAAARNADVATVSFIAGATLIATGAVLYLTAPSGEDATLRSSALRVAAVVGPAAAGAAAAGGVTVSGSF